MKLNIQKSVEVDAKTLHVFVKVRDEFASELRDKDGASLCRYEGYVPKFFPGDHHGDYLILHIDVDTGQITNWEPPDAGQLERFIQQANNEEQYE